MHYDLLFLHPPSVYDFRDMPWFPGPVARLVPESTSVFMTIPVGLMSIADYLDRNGFKVKIINLCEMMLSDPDFNVEYFLKKADAAIFGIDLHWCTHSQGAVEIARLCKKHHPNSLVVLGGLTATRFASEIVSKFRFIDAVVRGEAERPMLKLAQVAETRRLYETPNLTYQKNSKIHINNDMKVVKNLDMFDFTRFDLLEPRDRVMTLRTPWGPWKHWSIPVCRGCLFNCVTCGGSSYSYRTLLKRRFPAFRSPEKIAHDFQKLSEQGIDHAFLFQDIRMGGKKYWQNLLKTLHREKTNIKEVVMELFYPADDKFLESASRFRPAEKVAFTISPESGAEDVRKACGKNYSNEDLLQTGELCLKHRFKLLIFFMTGLALENRQSVEETYRLWDNLLRLNIAANKLNLLDFDTVRLSWGPMVLLDPGSLAFDFPEKYGYHLLFKNFEDHYKAMSIPCWTQWISYETKYFARKDLIELPSHFSEQEVNLYEKYGLYSKQYAATERSTISMARTVNEELERIMREENESKREKRLETLYRAVRLHLRATSGESFRVSS